MLVIDCGSPGKLINGETFGSVFTFGHSIYYRCLRGYRMEGGTERKSSITCQEDGKWNGSVPVCNGM